MEKTNEELFKQALIEGFNNRIQREIDACKDEIVCSRRHKRIMKSIIKGKITTIGWNIPNKKVIAILVAAALLFVSCAIIYRDEIRDIITEVHDLFTEIHFSKGNETSQYIEEIYHLTYLPNDYTLSSSNISYRSVQYHFVGKSQSIMIFLQQPIDTSDIILDSEHGNESIIIIGKYKIYSRKTNDLYCYIWNDGKYILALDSTEELSNETLKQIINGIVSK